MKKQTNTTERQYRRTKETTALRHCVIIKYQTLTYKPQESMLYDILKQCLLCVSIKAKSKRWNFTITEYKQQCLCRSCEPYVDWMVRWPSDKQQHFSLCLSQYSLSLLLREKANSSSACLSLAATATEHVSHALHVSHTSFSSSVSKKRGSLQNRQSGRWNGPRKGKVTSAPRAKEHHQV